MNEITKKIDDAFESLVGLKKVKDEIKKIILSYTYTENARDSNHSLNMCFLGNPGTGKTRTAKIFADLLYEANILPINKVICTNRNNFVAEYVGQTAIKTKKLVESAIGGTLIIDDADDLIYKHDPFGIEALNTLISELHINKGKICVIVCGYEDLPEKLNSISPGIMPKLHKIEFLDYTKNEFMNYIISHLSAKNYSIDDDALEMLLNTVEYFKQQPEFANIRTVQYITEQVLMDHQHIAVSENIEDNRIVLSDIMNYINKNEIHI